MRRGVCLEMQGEATEYEILLRNLANLDLQCIEPNLGAPNDSLPMLKPVVGATHLEGLGLSDDTSSPQTS